MVIKTDQFTPYFNAMVAELNRKDRYKTYNIQDFFRLNTSALDPEKVHIGMRLDVDADLDCCIHVGTHFKQHGIESSFYFLTHPDRYYNVWESKIPQKLARMGFEIGLHSDHLYGHIVLGQDGIPSILEDISRLRELAGIDIVGLFAHGHEKIPDSEDKIWNLFKRIDHIEHRILYHDGIMEEFEKKNNVVGIQDFLRVTNSWRLWPRYPAKALERIPSGTMVVMKLHPHNFFIKHLSTTKKSFPYELVHMIRFRLRYQVLAEWIGEGKNARQELARRLLPKFMTKWFSIK